MSSRRTVDDLHDLLTTARCIVTYARHIARHSFRASAYALSGRARLLQLELLLLEIACLDAWLAGRQGLR